MRAHILLGICALCLSAFLAVTVQAQQNLPDTPSAQSAQTSNEPVVEGTVISTTKHTLVVRTDDERYHRLKSWP